MAIEKIDSNASGLRFAEEETPKNLPGSPVWYPLEPNSYSDFGGALKTVAREPINQSRQRKKGTTTDLDASGGFNQDLTQNNMTRLLQGVVFADVREKFSSIPMNGTPIAMTAIAAADDKYTAASGLNASKVLVNSLLFASGFGAAANNGFRRITAVAAGALTVAESLADEAAPPATAKIEIVGYRFASATVDITVVSGLPRIARASGSVDFTTLGLIPGEWIYLGSDNTNSSFANNVGFARVNAVATTYIELDKTDWTPAAETGTGLTVEMFFGQVLKNESDPDNVVRRTYQLERALGEDDDGTMSEYLVGAQPNEMTINVAQADKVTVDISFVATDNEQRTGATDLKSGDRPAIVNADPFNTTNDFSRIKLSTVEDDDAAPSPLFAFATELKLTVNNNVKPQKAIGVLGAFDTSAGLFEVGGSMTAYFADIGAVQAVRENADVTLDIAMVKQNAGIVFDIPLLSLGNARLNIEKDSAITLPLDVNAAESKFNHTLMIGVFPYLPTVAAA